jgi:glycolate oxidase iron-sulfur subunit
MDVKLHASLATDRDALRAADAIESCVHCGFCLATCPTYLDTRDERDSPRGRIYLLKELLETGRSDTAGQYHLDRCLSCRSCETTCPSGVRYGEIADSGRALLERNLARSFGSSVQRYLLRKIVPHRQRFAPLLRIGQLLRPLLPAALRTAVPPRQVALSQPQNRQRARTVLLLEGCVQAAATPNTNAAARRILDHLDIGISESPSQGCCGALNTHLGATDDGRDDMRRNIDAWWPAIEDGAEAIISTATGCGSQLADYATALADDADYAARATRVSALARDLSGFLLAQDLGQLPGNPAAESRRIAVHVPCSQMHALREPDSVRQLLRARGYDLSNTRDDHLCCGSAGSYSLLQPAMSARLRERKLDALSVDQPELIVSANIGCQLHLAQAADIPVRHWTELLLEGLEPGDSHERKGN